MRIIYIGVLLFIFLIVAIKINIFNLKKRQVNHNINAQLLITNKINDKYILYGYYENENTLFKGKYYRKLYDSNIYKFTEEEQELNIIINKNNKHFRIQIPDENKIIKGVINGLAFSQTFDQDSSVAPYIFGGILVSQLNNNDLIIKDDRLEEVKNFDFEPNRDITLESGKLKFQNQNNNINEIIYKVQSSKNLRKDEETEISLYNNKYIIKALIKNYKNEFLIISGNTIINKETKEQYITTFIGYKYIKPLISKSETIGSLLGAIVNKNDPLKGASQGGIVGGLFPIFNSYYLINKGTQISIIFTMDIIKINNQIE